MSPSYPADGLLDVRYRWPFSDLLEAHLALDATEEMKEIAHAEAKAKAEAEARNRGRK